jgi:hypothetical protein
MADFNGDGIADLAVSNEAGSFIRLGRGDGTFNSIEIGFGGESGSPWAAADFNGDGKTDLLTIQYNSPVFLLAGNGDGTFQAGVPVLPNGFPVVADFNGDGKPDLAVVTSNGVNILLGKGDGTFQSPIVSSAGFPTGTITALWVGDFNGDGRPDLAVHAGNILGILLGVGDGTFQAPLNDPAGTFDGLLVTDLNRDGKADLVILSSSNKIAIQLGNGDGTFRLPVSYAVGFDHGDVDVGDFNGDGNADLAVGTSNSNSVGSVSILLGNGDGTFRPPINYLTYPAYVVAPIAGDFNGDGKTDLYAGGTFLLGTTLSLTATGGSPQSTPVGTALPIQLQATLLDSANPVSGATVTFSVQSPGAARAVLSAPTATTDGSGVARVTATANQSPGSYTVTASYDVVSTSFALTNTVGPPAILTTVSGTPQSAPVGTAFANALKVKLTDSAGNPASGVNVTFTVPAAGATAVLSSGTVQTDASGVASVTATAGSIGGPYTVTASFGSLSAPFVLDNLLSSTVTLAASLNPSTFGAPVTLTATVTPSSASGRVTFYDGTTVLGTKPLSGGAASLSTILLPTGARKLTAYYSGDAYYLAGTASFTETVKSVAAVGFGAQGSVSLGSISPTDVAVGDFNGDGKADLAITSRTSGANTVTILLGKGDGTFQPPASYPAGSGTPSIAIADFNGDGNSDIAVSSSDNQGSGLIGMLLGNGDGTFRPAINLPITVGFPSGLGSMAVADFNGDGKPDLLLIASQPAILLGNGDGTFQSPLTLQMFGPFNTSVVVGDFNGDGKPDIVIAGNGLQIALGNGDGTFQAFSTINNGNLGARLTVADFNGDGKLDLMMSGSLSVLLGNGDGTFQPPVSSSIVGNAPIIGDFNSDGIADLAIVNSNTVNLLQGNGDGTFHLVLSYTTAGVPYVLAAADFNGDGRVDLASVSTNQGGNVTILLGVASGVSLTVTGGSSQTAVAGAAFVTPLQVTVVQNGTPVNSAIVNFTAPSAGASAVLTPTAVTNTAGIATVNATANNIPGSYVVTASYQGLTASFSLANTTVGGIVATSGTPQTALLYAPFPKPLVVTVRDSAGNLASGVTVTFTAPLSGASVSLSPITAVTNTSGQASAFAYANNTAGTYTVTASAGGLPASFSLTNTSLSVTISGGTPQSAVVGTPFPNALQVTARDSAGNPVSNASVTFFAPQNGASAVLSPGGVGNFGIASTNAAGVASLIATANNTPGTYTVTASVSVVGQTLPLSFSLTNLPASGGGNSNLAFGKSATQSSTFPSSTAGASSAVDGNTDGNFAHGSVTATNSDANAWWQVDLGASASIASIVISNRTDCCSARLSDYWVFVSDIPFNYGETPTSLQGRANTWSSHQTTAPNPSSTIAVNATGRYVRVQLSGTDYLSLAEVQVIGTGAPAAVNLAPGKAATQSSTLAGSATAGALSAIDGRTDGSFFNGSVTATNPEANPWWQLDLGASANVNNIVIWNRTDCCGSRLSDFWVFVSNTPFSPNDTPLTLQNRPGTFSSHQTTAPDPSIAIAVNAQGRYIRVQLSGTDVLSLAEVQIFGTSGGAAINLAPGRTASQSSTLPGAPTAGAMSAVDGNTDGSFSHGSVTATNLDTNAWWQLDLGGSATVDSIAIWNRADCCSSRLSDYWVFVSDIPFGANDTPATLQNRAGTFASHQTVAPNPSATIAVGAQGRYLRVQLSGTDYLSLAEVQVYGIGPLVTNLSLGKSASQSSTLAGTPAAGVAVDGNTDGNFGHGSVTATNLDANPWWQVDLGASASIDSIVVWNRTDCCSSRLGNYWVFVSDTPFLATDTPATLQNRPGTFGRQVSAGSTPSNTIVVGAAGRYVRVQLAGANYLSLAEVQVFGQ